MSIGAKEVRRRADQSQRSLGQAERLTYSIPEAAKLGIGINSCYAAAKAGQIPTIKIGDRVLVPRTALDNMLLKAGA